jgi:hypothetical protein
MFASARLAAISIVPLVWLTQWSVAQGFAPSIEQLLPAQLRIDEVRVTPRSTVVRGSRVQPDGRTVHGWVVGCDRSNPDGAWLFVLDLAANTDDRMVVEASFCDAFRAAVHRRQGTQGR